MPSTLVDCIIRVSPRKIIYVKSLSWFEDGMLKNMEWHSRKNLQDWFGKLTPEQRLTIALEIEKLRREARFVEP